MHCLARTERRHTLATGLALNMDTIGYKALVIGASGTIGSGFMQLLQAAPHYALVEGLHRHSQPSIDFAHEASIAAAAAAMAEQAPFDLIINAAGLLHTPRFMPEKRLADLGYSQMLETFQANTFGPALTIAHFSKLLNKQRGVMAVISAKVGSIEDNRLGGWYSYRASKAALNMLLKTAAIELKRNQPNAILIALHPGTVNSKLSEPYRGAEIGRTAEAACQDMLHVIDGLTAADSGKFYAYNGVQLPW